MNVISYVIEQGKVDILPTEFKMSLTIVISIGSITDFLLRKWKKMRRNLKMVNKISSFQETAKFLIDRLNTQIISYFWNKEFIPVTESNGESYIYPDNTYAECVEIVLPQHANHHQTTFGGQVFLKLFQSLL